jgi:hypothetical protein
MLLRSSEEGCCSGGLEEEAVSDAEVQLTRRSTGGFFRRGFYPKISSHKRRQKRNFVDSTRQEFAKKNKKSALL